MFVWATAKKIQPLHIVPVPVSFLFTKAIATTKSKTCWCKTPLKGTVSRDFRPLFFCLKDSPHMNWTGKNGFANIFVFAKIFYRILSQNKKISSPCCRWQRRHANFLKVRKFSHFDIIAIACVNTSQVGTFFHLIVTFKSPRSLQSFPKVSA